MPARLRADKAEQGKASMSGVVLSSVDGMSQEEIAAAAAAAAAASGYGEPTGLASLVSKTAQVCMHEIVRAHNGLSVRTSLSAFCTNVCIAWHCTYLLHSISSLKCFE